jgi:hypothetical protein
MSYDSELDCAVRAAGAAGAILREAFHDSRVSGHFADHSELSPINRLIVAEEGVPVERRYSFPVGIFTRR